MMNTIKKYGFLLLLASAWMLVGCEKSFESYEPVVPSGSDTMWVNPGAANFLQIHQLHDSLQRVISSDSITLTAAGSILFPDNTRVEIPANSFINDNGTVADGKAKLEMISLRKKGDFIRFQKPTISNGYQLESGAMLFLQVTKNGNALSLAAGKSLSIAIRDSTTNPSMTGFIGVEPTANTTASFHWQKDSSSVSVTLSQNATNTYSIRTQKLRWINAGIFKDTNETKTRVVISLTKEFTNGNTSAWVVFKNSRSVLQMEADVNNRIFIKSKVAVNRPIYCITLSKRGTDYYLGVQETVTSANLNIEMRPVKISLQDLKNFLDTL